MRFEELKHEVTGIDGTMHGNDGGLFNEMALTRCTATS
jgi:hypothetical protein